MFSQSLRGTLISLASLVALVSATQSLSLKVSGMSAQKYLAETTLNYVPGPSSVSSVENLKLTTTLTNTGDETLKILNDPRGPLNKLPTDTFAISAGSGATPSFTGIKLKYVPSTAVKLGAFTVLAPGESVAVDHDRAFIFPWGHRASANLCLSSSCAHVQLHRVRRGELRHPRAQRVLDRQRRLDDLDDLRRLRGALRSRLGKTRCPAPHLHARPPRDLRQLHRR